MWGKRDKLNVDFTSYIGEVHQGSDEKWAEDIGKLINSSVTQASKSKKKGKTTFKEKGKVEPKQKWER